MVNDGKRLVPFLFVLGMITSFVAGWEPIQQIDMGISSQQNLCNVNVNLEMCSYYITADFPIIQDDCDCYNFCGNIPQSCCKFGEPCQIQCESGSLVAGCILKDTGFVGKAYSVESGFRFEPDTENEYNLGESSAFTLGRTLLSMVLYTTAILLCFTS